MATISKEELLRDVAWRSGISKNNTEFVIDALIDSIAESLSNGDRVMIRGFGTFEPKYRAARSGRAAEDGSKIFIPPQVKPAFKPGKTLVLKVQGYDIEPFDDD